MKTKTGKCIDCPPDSGEVPLIAKRCGYCYKKYRIKVNEEKLKKKAERDNVKVVRFQGKLMTADEASKKAEKMKDVRSKRDKRSRKKTSEAIKEFDVFMHEHKELYPDMRCVECGSRVLLTGQSLSHILSAQVLKKAYYDHDNAVWMCTPFNGCGAHGTWHSSNKFDMKCYPELKEKSNKIKAKYHGKH